MLNALVWSYRWYAMAALMIMPQQGRLHLMVMLWLTTMMVPYVTLYEYRWCSSDAAIAAIAAIAANGARYSMMSHTIVDGRQWLIPSSTWPYATRSDVTIADVYDDDGTDAAAATITAAAVRVDTSLTSTSTSRCSDADSDILRAAAAAIYVMVIRHCIRWAYMHSTCTVNGNQRNTCRIDIWEW